MVCFVNDKPSIVNRKLIIIVYLFFFLSEWYAFLFLSSTGRGICCSVEYIKAIKLGKYRSTSSGVFSLMVILYNLLCIGKNTFI